jgi:acyl-CoA thioester hydrolase
MEDVSSRPLFVEQSIRVKTYDIDFVGHVNNAVYVRWLEDLRLQLLDTYYPLEEMTANDVSPIIVNTSIHYKQGIVLADKHVTAQMWGTKFERATFLLEARFVVGDEIRCTADQRGTFVDTLKMRPIRVPDELSRHFID